MKTKRKGLAEPKLSLLVRRYIAPERAAALSFDAARLVSVLASTHRSDGPPPLIRTRELKEQPTAQHFKGLSKKEGCDTNEEPEFIRVVNDLESAVANLCSAAHSVDSSTRDTRFLREPFNAFVQVNNVLTGHVWCLPDGENNSNFRRAISLQQKGRDCVKRVLDTYYANISTYRKQIVPLAQQAIDRARAILNSSYDGTSMVEAYKKFDAGIEEGWYAELVDERINNEITLIRNAFETADREFRAASLRLIKHYEARVSTFGSHARSAVNAQRLMCRADKDGKQQFEEFEKEFKPALAELEAVRKFQAIPDIDGRVRRAFEAFKKDFDELKSRAEKIPTFPSQESVPGLDLPGDFSGQRYGQPQLTQAIKAAANEWDKLVNERKLKPFQVTAIGYEHGGTLRFVHGQGAHAEHKGGAEADLNCLSSAGVYGQTGYKAELWQALAVFLLRHSSINKLIFADAAVLKGAEAQAGRSEVTVVRSDHDDHLHISLHSRYTEPPLCS